jgi:hypothetical protein
LENEYFPDECGDHFDIQQPIPQGRKPCQSSFSLDFEDMASPYGGGGGERGVRCFSSAASTIEVDDFKREFTMWYELQKSRNTNFHPYMVWRALFGCLEGAPLADYEEFEAAHFTEIVAWRNYYTQIMQMCLEESPGWWIHPVQVGVKRRKRKANPKKKNRSQGMW